MTINSQVLLTFLLNACWQIALVAGLASFASWLLRNSVASYRHWIWVAALLLCFGIPLATIWQKQIDLNSLTARFEKSNSDRTVIEPLVSVNTQVNDENLAVSTDVFLMSRTPAQLLLSIYFLITLYSVFRLVRAWIVTRRLRLSAITPVANPRLEAIAKKCAFSVIESDKPIPVQVSDKVPVPITIGIFNPMVILPATLLSEDNDELLTSAVGHELVHIQRRDYLFNFVYELLYLPLSFHPGAALIKRRIRQTRELTCDEVVAERILSAEAYARSLVKLASSAPPLQRLSVTTTVGIADADILEARIMSLLKKPKLDTRGKRLTLIGISLVLLVPCLAAASFAMKFDLKPSAQEPASQEPSQQEKERREKQATELMRMRESAEKVNEQLPKERIANDLQFRDELRVKREFEVKMRAIRQAALIRAARISMDQAIQIATSQKPGKVLECSLDAEHWKEPGVLASDGFVFYRVVLVANEDGDNGAVTHVWVNAVDGTIIKTEKELPRKERP